MENLKIRVNSADESKEIQNILESKGFKKWEECHEWQFDENISKII